MYKQLGLSTLSGGITAFLVGGLLYGALLAGFFAAQSTAPAGVMMETPNMLGIAAGNFVFALMLALIFHRWANISTFQTGVIAGAWISFLVVLSFDTIMMSTANMMTGLGMVVDVLVFTAIGAVTGGVVGLVLGRVKAT